MNQLKNFSFCKTLAVVLIASLGWEGCANDTRDDHEESGKVSTSDSTTNDKPRQGYAQEGLQRVNSGTDSTGRDLSGNTPRNDDPNSKDTVQWKH